MLTQETLWRFLRSTSWKKAMDGFFHSQFEHAAVPHVGQCWFGQVLSKAGGSRSPLEGDRPTVLVEHFFPQG